MAKCYTRITEDNGLTMYCIVDTTRHELSEFIDDDGIAIDFSLGEFWKQDCPWVLCCKSFSLQIVVKVLY